VVGYLFKAPQPDGSFVRSLLIDEQPGFVAKDGTGRLPGPIIYNPNLTSMVEYLRGKPEAIAAQPHEAAQPQEVTV